MVNDIESDCTEIICPLRKKKRVRETSYVFTITQNVAIFEKKQARKIVITRLGRRWMFSINVTIELSFQDDTNN